MHTAKHGTRTSPGTIGMHKTLLAIDNLPAMKELSFQSEILLSWRLRWLSVGNIKQSVGNLVVEM